MLAIKGNTRDTEICHVNSRDFPAEERLNEHQVYVREVFLKSKLGNVYFDGSKDAFDIKCKSVWLYHQVEVAQLSYFT